METIFYVEKKRGTAESIIEPIGMKTYLLVRVSLDVETNQWFDVSLQSPTMPREEQGQSGEAVDAMEREAAAGHPLLEWLRRPFRLRHIRRQAFLARSRECERRYNLLREYHLQLDLWEERIRKTEAAIIRLLSDLTALCEPREPAHIVYEEELRAVLFRRGRLQRNICLHMPGKTVSVEEEGELIIPGLWSRHCAIPEFKAFANPFWVEQILTKQMNRQFPQHIVIIGANANACPFLERNCARLKSILWRLPEGECDEAFLNYLEEFYEASGMVICYQTYSDMTMLCEESLVYGERTAVLDFTAEERLPRLTLPRGSLWLDIYSSEKKQRKMQSVYPMITYISLKSMWKQIQKSRNKPFILDIAEGNGYNTLESEGIARFDLQLQ